MLFQTFPRNLNKLKIHMQILISLGIFFNKRFPIVAIRQIDTTERNTTTRCSTIAHIWKNLNSIIFLMQLQWTIFQPAYYIVIVLHEPINIHRTALIRKTLMSEVLTNFGRKEMVHPRT